uniref:Elongin-A n=1 Tax=Tetraselmis sp. GSL018 TaxID=582737 RepID=A0A061R0B7_9CHLO|mmetsp:Transcript_5067/g.12349  ORF Transcript_5067/g.12349 Transcript_5067/m.12349 type:complete len:316 (-) Transcript_5067:128-1075(-)
MAHKTSGQGLLGQVLRNKQEGRSFSLPSLQKLCLDVLISLRSELRDVGEVPAPLLRPILKACSVEQLKLIESETRLGTGRNLKWDTWDLWRRLYINDFGDPGIEVQVPPILCPKPRDYKPSRSARGIEPGDWRRLYEETSKSMADKHEDAVMRIRMRYEEANRSRQHRTAQISVSDVPDRKQRSSAHAAGSTTTSAKDRLKAKLNIRSLGEPNRKLAPAKGSRATSSGGQKRTAPAGNLSSRPAGVSKASSSAKQKASSSLTRKPFQTKTVSKPHNSLRPTDRAEASNSSRTSSKAPARMDVNSLISGMRSSVKD